MKNKFKQGIYSFFHLDRRLKILYISLSVILLIFAIGIIDVTNFDNIIHSWVFNLLRIKNYGYYDIPFLDTSLRMLEIIALFLAVIVSFLVLRTEQEDNKKRIRLEHQPFIVPSEIIEFEAFSYGIKVVLENIGVGPALFARISYVEIEPDNPDNAILQNDQPHSQYIGSAQLSSEIIFDLRNFYKFITGVERGGELGADPGNYNNRILRSELTGLIDTQIGKDFFVYVHAVDILGYPLVFKIKYLLIRGEFGKYILKRMEIELIKGFLVV